MGYYVEIIQSDAYIPADKIEAACRGMEPMMQPDHVVKMGHGGYVHTSDGECKQVWYSWINDDECRDLLSKNDLAGFLEHWGFETHTLDSDGAIYIQGYDSKTGQEEYMLQNLAPFVAPNTTIMWRGEDGAMWADAFDGEKMVEKNVKLVVE